MLGHGSTPLSAMLGGIGIELDARDVQQALFADVPDKAILALFERRSAIGRPNRNRNYRAIPETIERDVAVKVHETLPFVGTEPKIHHARSHLPANSPCRTGTTARLGTIAASGATSGPTETCSFVNGMRTRDEEYHGTTPPILSTTRNKKGLFGPSFPAEL
jgi:hypothetical protein